MEVELTTNEVLLILLALWSICFWVCGWVANFKRRKNENKNRQKGTQGVLD